MITITNIREPSFSKEGRVEHEIDDERERQLAGDIENFIMSKGFYSDVKANSMMKK